MNDLLHAAHAAYAGDPERGTADLVRLFEVETLAIVAGHIAPEVVDAVLVGSGGYAAGPFSTSAHSGIAGPASARPVPLEVVDHGAEDLRDLLKLSQVPILTCNDGAGLVELPHGGVLASSAGPTAVELGLTWGPDVIVLDRMVDVARTTAVAMAAHPDCGTAALDSAIGLVQAAGITVHLVPDLPGLVNARLMATVGNLAIDLVETGAATADELDAAFGAATGAPPQWWSGTLPPGLVMELLGSLYEWYDEPRYRPTPRQRRESLRQRTATARVW